MAYRTGVILGPINHNTSGSSVTNIGTGSYSGLISIGNTNANTVNIDCGTAGINVGATANAHTTTVGSASSTSITTVQSGSGLLTIQSANGGMSMLSGTGTIGISTDSAATTVNIGTGSAVKGVTLGSVSSTSSTSINTGTGSCLLGSNATDHATTVGSITGASLTTIQSGSSGMILTGVAGVNIGSVAHVISMNTGTGAIGTTDIVQGTGITVTAGANTITIAASGSSAFTITRVNTTPYVVLAADNFLAVDSSGGAISIELPNAPATGKVYEIKDSTGSAVTNNITVTTVGGVVVIDGATSQIMNTQYESLNVIFDGTTYQIF